LDCGVDLTLERVCRISFKSARPWRASTSLLSISRRTKKKTFEFPVLFHDSIAGSQATQPPVQSHRGPRNLRGQSVYSEPGGAPVIMSSTPPLFREEFLTDATAFDLGRNQIDVASHAVPQIPCQSASLSGRSATSEVSRFEGSKSSSPKLPRSPRSRSPTPF